jgi:hypothetical protein
MIELKKQIETLRRLVPPDSRGPGSGAEQER